ncbi:uncharacterized protein Eint_011000 [Encephalitozoon intestinalis ATCC 50506]|uniref:Myb-like domain-containing protein n=1 Tax=Encephalitozoon intestinalis (strain ATCC 50506) TaxID=876142 RepID=E0S5H7_ENCIT|nr:uncharacterized protein Eint_011000 [Encephalitozoon intestinalis ATCC 50506]ADM10962.1 hypothetical protein Eint_011000 [Encephalitozoon intestinalis ATCC 50506]UTX44599.1 hypothetical protein GPK93_01g01090 [Encephalitozoon intestinalis]
MKSNEVRGNLEDHDKSKEMGEGDLGGQGTELFGDHKGSEERGRRIEGYDERTSSTGYLERSEGRQKGWTRGKREGFSRGKGRRTEEHGVRELGEDGRVVRGEEVDWNVRGLGERKGGKERARKQDENYKEDEENRRKEGKFCQEGMKGKRRGEKGIPKNKSAESEAYLNKSSRSHQLLNGPLCGLHTSANNINIEEIENMLYRDVMNDVSIDIPGHEIVPILCFFENSRELKASGFRSVASFPMSLEEDPRKLLVSSEKGKMKSSSGKKRKTETNLEDGKARGRDKEMVPLDMNDCRYKYFLKRAFPTMQRDDEKIQKYIEDQRTMLLKRAKNNKAEIPDVGSGPSKAPMTIISCIPEIPPIGFSEEEDKIASELIQKYRNNFRKIEETASHLETKKCILKYYLAKDKTYSYMKHKSGRISDLEVKLIIERGWSEYERNIFIQHFRVFGKSWGKYRPLINRPERDLKMFFRYYTKFVLPQNESLEKTGEPVKRASISKEDVLKKWTIDERQVFAIYFPYYNKNWVSMAAYFPAKTSGDLRQYYNRYFKGLSYNEQRLEASLYNFGRKLTTPPAKYIGNSKEEIIFCTTAGVLFKR